MFKYGSDDEGQFLSFLIKFYLIPIFLVRFVKHQPQASRPGGKGLSAALASGVFYPFGI
jgi:hypothetical protein